jgi:hypothetical protein
MLHKYSPAKSDPAPRRSISYQVSLVALMFAAVKL